MWIGEVGSEGFTLMLQKVEYFRGASPSDVWK